MRGGDYAFWVWAMQYSARRVLLGQSAAAAAAVTQRIMRAAL